MLGLRELILSVCRCRARVSAIALICTSIVFSTAIAAAQQGGVDLSAVPPNLSASVDPNIVVTFDDSGSMVWTHMGDARPYDGQQYSFSWNGPWRCASVIDPRGTSVNDVRSRTMNGVYYNPNIDYRPPFYEDGTSFPEADATLKAVWADGIAIKRPASANQIPAQSPIYADNPDGILSASSDVVADLTGTRGDPPTDNRWRCGNAALHFADGAWQAARGVQNPFNGTTPDPDTGDTPNGGPVYWRFKSTATALLTTSSADGAFTAEAKRALYDAKNWEAVSVPASQYQNFANWYAYYRNRSLMARSSLSRVFGGLGNNIRVAWQNLGFNDNLNSPNPQLPSNTIITNLDNTTPFPQTDGLGTVGYRTAFFNWIYSVKANGGTPLRTALIRAGEFFKRGNSQSLADPYWEPGAGDAAGQEVACRQNFHMLVTDGLYNGESPSVSGNGSTTSSAQALPPSPPRSASNPAQYSPGTGKSPTTIFPGPGDLTGGSTYSDIAFYYWANNLRPDLAQAYPYDHVPPYFSDLSIGVTSSGANVNSADPGATPEVFWNPVNDPATWPHLVQFAVSLGAIGSLQYSSDIDCSQPDGSGALGNNDLCKLRQGRTNSSGSVGWPQPNGVDGAPANIDDLWHAALNSRGAFFVATDPTSLVQHLKDILTSIVSRRTSATDLSATMSILTADTQAFPSGFDSSDYAGFLYKQDLGSNTPLQRWEAGCLLTGGASAWTSSGCKTPMPPPDAGSTRKIYTTTSGSTLVPFQWSSLSQAQQSALNQDPRSTTTCASASDASAGCDGNGEARLNWLRGARTAETAPPNLRKRSTVLGAIINSQPQYISAPTAGFSDSFPAKSPEAVAAEAHAGYQDYVLAKRARSPNVYVGANDGMLHAFDAQNGAERWAYVPNTLFANGRLAAITDPLNYKKAPGVDNTPIIQDVFINGEWRTILVCALRLGGRGIFALDITDPKSPKFLWEKSNLSEGFSDLGYTYGYPNIARLSNGKWVVLVPSGYFPLANSIPIDPASGEDAANRTSLFVIDVATGALLRQIKTSAAPQDAPQATFGLSAPAVYDLDSDQIDDIAIAGDLAGNLWRFDLTATSPNGWSVDLIFQSYEKNSDIGRRPISAMPVGMRDTFAKTPLWVVGTGKYLGLCDRTSRAPPKNCGADSNTATQAVYGIRDYGTASPVYPVKIKSLTAWRLSEDGSGVRSQTIARERDSNNRGWQIPLDLQSDAGERVVINVVPDYSQNFVIVPTLIPSTPDPCDPRRRGAIMVIDATGGGPRSTSPLIASGSDSSNGNGSGGGSGSGENGESSPNSVVGKSVTSDAIPISGQLTVLGFEGSGLTLPGLDGFKIQTPPPHRNGWRELLDSL